METGTQIIWTLGDRVRTRAANIGTIVHPNPNGEAMVGVELDLEDSPTFWVVAASLERYTD